MKFLFKTDRAPVLRAEKERAEALRRRLLEAAAADGDILLEELGSAAGGLDEAAVRLAREEHGANLLPKGRTEPLFRRLFLRFFQNANLIVHRGVTGGWDIDAPAAMSAGLVCGLYVFSRYLERENEFLTV